MEPVWKSGCFGSLADSDRSVIEYEVVLGLLAKLVVCLFGFLCWMMKLKSVYLNVEIEEVIVGWEKLSFVWFLMDLE